MIPVLLMFFRCYQYVAPITAKADCRASAVTMSFQFAAPLKRNFKAIRCRERKTRIRQNGSGRERCDDADNARGHACAAAEMWQHGGVVQPCRAPPNI
ncbi:MAG: hypothetical protein WA792_09215 [Pseudolabrys sp.]